MQTIRQGYVSILDNGSWFGSERQALDAEVDRIQEHVSGIVRLKLFKGGCAILERRPSPASTRLTIAGHAMLRAGEFRTMREGQRQRATEVSPASMSPDRRNRHRMARLFFTIAGLLAIGCHSQTNDRRADCMNANLPKYRACLLRVIDTRSACEQQFRKLSSDWCGKHLPAADLSKEEVHVYSSACFGEPLDSELCAFMMRQALQQDLLRVCRFQFQRGAHEWPSESEFRVCKSEKACCTDPAAHALDECEQAVRYANQQCK